MNWCVYLLSNGTRTYIGSTTDVNRRLRQHNGELRGGAKSTRNSISPWELVCYISGFENRSSACRWERIVKCRARGLNKRRVAMVGVVFQECPKGRTVYEVPSGLEIHYGT